MERPAKSTLNAALARFLSGEPVSTVEEADTLERAIRLHAGEAFAETESRSAPPKRRWWWMRRLAKA